MPRRPIFARGDGPNLVVHVLSHDVHILGNVGSDWSSLDNDPLNSLQIVSKDSTPPIKEGPDLRPMLPREVANQYFDCLWANFLEGLREYRFYSFSKERHREIYNEIAAPHVKLDFDEALHGCNLVRSSSGWTKNERHGIEARFLDSCWRQLEMGCLPALALGDGTPGSEIMRPGVRHLLGLAMQGEIDYLFLHTMRRFSRTSRHGNDMLVLLHRLIGNIQFFSKQVHQWLDVDPDNRSLMSLVSREIAEGEEESARTGQRINDHRRIAFGTTGVYPATTAYRLFQAARRP